MTQTNNIPPFYVGQKVVYVGDSKPYKSGSHTVKFMQRLKCGNYSVDLGYNYKRHYKYIECTCGCFTETNSNTVWFKAKNLRPLEELKYPLISLSKVIEQERELLAAN